MADTIFHPLFAGPEFKTQVYITDEAEDEFKSFRKKNGNTANKYIAQLKRFAKTGFEHHDGRRGAIRYKSEWEIWATQPGRTLFRFYGFYSPHARSKTIFLATTATLKRGMRMGKKDRNAAAEAARIMKSGEWGIED